MPTLGRPTSRIVVDHVGGRAVVPSFSEYAPPSGLARVDDRGRPAAFSPEDLGAPPQGQSQVVLARASERQVTGRLRALRRPRPAGRSRPPADRPSGAPSSPVLCQSLKFSEEHRRLVGISDDDVTRGCARARQRDRARPHPLPRAPQRRSGVRGRTAPVLRPPERERLPGPARATVAGAPAGAGGTTPTVTPAAS